MTVMVGAFFVAALLAVPLFRLFGRNAFLILAAVPAAGLVLSLQRLPAFLAGGGDWIESYSWLPALNLEVVFLLSLIHI